MFGVAVAVCFRYDGSRGLVPTNYIEAYASGAAAFASHNASQPLPATTPPAATAPQSPAEEGVFGKNGDDLLAGLLGDDDDDEPMPAAPPLPVSATASPSPPQPRVLPVPRLSSSKSVPGDDDVEA
jgi:hypothetical protein